MLQCTYGSAKRLNRQRHGEDIVCKKSVDVDGDQANCIGDSLLINIAERNIRNHDVVPLLYDMGKAGSAPVTKEAFFDGLKRAHDYSGIGQVSNSLTKLWNRDNPDYVAAGLLCFYNNLVIGCSHLAQ